jgi:hypothetical protein
MPRISATASMSASTRWPICRRWPKNSTALRDITFWPQRKRISAGPMPRRRPCCAAMTHWRKCIYQTPATRRRWRSIIRASKTSGRISKPITARSCRRLNQASAMRRRTFSMRGWRKTSSAIALPRKRSNKASCNNCTPQRSICKARCMPRISRLSAAFAAWLSFPFSPAA